MQSAGKMLDMLYIAYNADIARPMAIRAHRMLRLIDAGPYAKETIGREEHTTKENASCFCRVGHDMSTPLSVELVSLGRILSP